MNFGCILRKIFIQHLKNCCNEGGAKVHLQSRHNKKPPILEWATFRNTSWAQAQKKTNYTNSSQKIVYNYYEQIWTFLTTYGIQASLLTWSQLNILTSKVYMVKKFREVIGGLSQKKTDQFQFSGQQEL